MSDKSTSFFENKGLISGAIATVAVLGSLYMFNKLRTMEQSMSKKTEKLEQIIGEMQSQGRGASLGDPSGNSQSLIDAKISSVQQTVR